MGLDEYPMPLGLWETERFDLKIKLLEFVDGEDACVGWFAGDIDEPILSDIALPLVDTDSMWPWGDMDEGTLKERLIAEELMKEW